MNILFVCSGNTCRSPMAEALARKIAKRRGIEDLNVSSAGTNAWDNIPATDEALLVGMERDIDLTGHRARKLSPAIVSEADLIFVMTPGHLEQVKQLGGRGKVHVIDEYASGTANQGITDPYGGDLEAYRNTADVLERELEKLFDRIGTRE
ncbi:MAG TPA: low molecular weight protein arginine phosphatase [Gemmatimonadaceae bacterium]|jgi:protein-tyrosine-phosphatase|nr:low molecular weight protein arginine phosphatase [Gemmatimonadaceae bacterium]